MAFDPSQKLTTERIATLPPLCTDGAWGTELQKLGGMPGQMLDIWNVEQPEKVLRVARAYVDAGAQVILTNTFNSNRIALARKGMEDRAAELSRAGAAISKEAARGRAYVFASMGPSGRMVMMGEIAPEEVEDAAAEQAEALAEGGADAIVVETQSDLEEMRALLAGCLRGAPGLPVGISLTFDAGEHNDYTMMGVSIPQAYEFARDHGAAFVGANCGAGIETFVDIARAFQACGNDLPIWVKGNAGKPEMDAEGRAIFSASPEVYARVVPELLDAGARFIGGCCGSTPAHVQAIAQAMERQ